MLGDFAAVFRSELRQSKDRTSAMRFTALQDPCGQRMVFDLRSGFPARMPDMLLLGPTREEAELLAGQANEFLSVPRSAVPLSRYLIAPQWNDWASSEL
ncbi:hypothetical protein LB523_26300 [Mesorhizobium sp. ESP-6-4]|uniref:hypothetical protein n=1 Tax=unclassified Mesorhizobium TaxID=325217 RepID=UPI001CC97608|nr:MULTISPECIES: hypothetical protein [unclassified Mesorhizobium]MBZ9662567.1 hypothetical protein [Mesorhizobium sp. ESP-6-4]MBZ9817494.1 hypothetical protein [Mesorhizobium sp. CA7]